MVSTRGYKLKFFEGEKVLCYEPDPTKAKVLYDSKVLDIVINKDQRGKKTVEYLIHFQGWNSSWDRCVGEEFVLKDTPENRQLQKDLADKSQLQLGAYLYRRERKKHNRKPSEPVGPSSEDGSSGSPSRMDTDDGQHTSSSDEDSSYEDDYIPIELTQNLKQLLENDYFYVNSEDKLHKLPAEPNVVSILEIYLQRYISQMYYLSEKSHSKYKIGNYNQGKLTAEEIHKNLVVCKEVLDGLRIYFDFTLNDLLLYKSEKGQMQTSPALTSSVYVKDEIKHEHDYLEYGHHSNNNSTHDIYNHNHNIHAERATRRRALRSSKYTEIQSNGNSHIEHVAPPKISPSFSNNNSDVSGPTFKPFSSRLLPDYVYLQQPAPPCLVYGATHLTRLLVKLPELLTASAISSENLKTLLRHVDCLIDFLNERKEWFGTKHYIDM